MNKFSKKLELIANILIICVATLLLFFLIRKFSNTDAILQSQKPSIVGTKISINALDWSKHPKTIVLVLQKGCRFCTSSASFYQSLSNNLKNKNVGIVAVLPGDEEESKMYLSELGIPNTEIKQSTLESLQIRGTPTILIIDKNGLVLKSWIGKLPPDKELEVFNELNL